MKKSLSLIGLLLLIHCSIHAQKVNVYPNSSYVQQNLDLNAVGLLFEKSRDIADFEKKINQLQDKISSLDLNNDGKVDYLRVFDKIENNIQIIKIQSEVSPNIYSDVASINVILKNRIKPLNPSHYNGRSNLHNNIDRSEDRDKNRDADRDINRERSNHNNDPIARTKEAVPLIYDFINIYSLIKNQSR